MSSKATKERLEPKPESCIIINQPMLRDKDKILACLRAKGEIAATRAATI